MRETLVKALHEEETFGYMKGEARWQELLESCGDIPWEARPASLISAR